MKIVQISTSGIQGGAARAACRLHAGLRQFGADSRMLVKNETLRDETVLNTVAADAAEIPDGSVFVNSAIQERYINARRTDISNTLFSLHYPGYDLSGLALVREADVINMHWVTDFQSPVTISRLIASGRPVVWTLHDQRAFTGGCHYSAGCEKYRHDCSSCPQLADDPFDLPAALLHDNVELFRRANLTIVAPSRWLAACARKSRLCADLRVEVIPNSVETDLFIPIPKETAKSRMGIKTDTLTLLFGAESGAEKRKGFRELNEALAYCLAREDFRQLVRRKKVMILCFGMPAAELQDTGIPMVSLGYLSSDEQICQAYAAADIFMLPSLEDNFPNTMLEAMSCGTPLIAFDAGGIPDVVSDRTTGRLVRSGDVSQMGEAIHELAFNGRLREDLGKNCRKLMVEEFGLMRQAERYVALYESLLGGASHVEPPAKRPADREDNTHASFHPSSPASKARVETEIGAHLRDIYAPVLYRSFDGFASDLERRSDAIKESLSWKITGPLRWIHGKLLSAGKMLK